MTTIMANPKIGLKACIICSNLFWKTILAKVAEKALRDAWRGRDQSVYSLYVKSAHIAAKLLPQKMMMALWLRQQGL